MYTRGSNALNPEYFTYDAPHFEKSVKAENQKRKSTVIKRKNAVVLKKRIITLVAVTAIMAFTFLSRYAAIASEFDTLSAKRNELENLNAQIVETKMLAQGNVDHKKVEQEAEKLGLRLPTDSQIKYISLGNTDNGEVLKSEKTNVLSAFINRVSVILEYLY